MKYQFMSAICVIALSTAVLAQTKQEKPEDGIKYRQSGMMFMRWNMRKIKNQVITSPETYNKQQVIAAANVISAIANSGIQTLFTPETGTGTGWKETLVKPEFFESPDDVNNHITRLTKEADALVTVSQSGYQDGIKLQFKKVLAACKGCHKDFRNSP